MDRETVIQNILTNYGEHGITREVIESIIDSGIQEGFSYDLIYLTLKAELSQLAGEKFFCSSLELAQALGMSLEEMDQLIDETRNDLIALGEDPDEYFMPAAPTTRFLM